MAEAFFYRMADPAKARALSVGTEPTTGMTPTVFEVMREAGIDLVAEGHHPKMVDWGLDEPKDQPIAWVPSAFL